MLHCVVVLCTQYMYNYLLQELNMHIIVVLI
jgi:hypothetical protein